MIQQFDPGQIKPWANTTLDKYFPVRYIPGTMSDCKAAQEHFWAMTTLSIYKAGLLQPWAISKHRWTITTLGKNTAGQLQP